MLNWQQRKLREQHRRTCNTAATRGAPKPDYQAMLAEAAANTLAAPAPPLLGLLLWPGGYPLHGIAQDLGARHSRFRIVCDDVMKSWQHLFGAERATIVLDPHELSLRRTGFAARVRQRQFAQIVTGCEACRALVAARLANAGDA